MLRIKIFLLALTIFTFGCSPEITVDEDSTNELWLMIKTNDFFRSGLEIEIEDKLIDIFEKNDLGELDGHSSGSHQFEVNFFEVTDYEKAKKAVDSLLKKEYPDLEYLVSQDYEITFEKLLK